MSTPKKKPSLRGLPGKTILTEHLRRKLNIDDRTLTINAKAWSDTTALVDDYFQNHELDFEVNSKNVFDDIVSVFSKIGSHDEPEGSIGVTCTLLRDYCTSVHKYLKQEHVYNLFARYFNLKEIEGRQNIQKIYKSKEQEVAEEAIERRSIVRVGKRAQDDINAERESLKPANIKMVKTSKSFTIHHPQSTTSTLNTPRLQKSDYKVLDGIADIKYRSTTQRSSSVIESIFNQARDEEKANVSLRNIPGAIEFLNNTILNNDHAFKHKYLWEKDNSTPFINTMKYITVDYYQNCLVPVPYNFEDERTFFCEVIIPILKTFAIHNKNIVFKWCEKQSKENNHSWLQNNDYTPKNIEKRLLDGYGISEDRGIAVMVESSGAESNVIHSVEDSIKQIKNATDFLTYLKARFKHSSAHTFTKLSVPSLLLIHNQLTMTITSINWNGKWQVVDVRTATVPTTRRGKFDLIKVFELLAKLKEIWDEQQQVILELGAEAAGVGEEFDITVGDHFSYQES